MRFRLVASVASILLLQLGAAPPPTVAAQVSDSEANLSNDDLIKLGDKLSSNDHYDEAIQAFTLVLQREPNNGAALAGRSMAYAATNRLQQAETDVDEAQRAIGDAAAVHTARGVIALRKTDDTRALQEFTAALSKDPADRWSLYFRARLFQHAHKDTAALADADTYVEAYPRAPEAYVLRGRILIAQQKRTAALLDADRLVRLLPDDDKILAAAAEIYNGAGDRERAFEAIGRAIAIKPNYYLYRFMRGRYRRWDDFAGERTDFTDALKLDPDNLDIVTDLAQLDFTQHRWSDAIAGFTRVLETDSKDYGVLAYRSMGYLNTNQEALAQSDHDKALEFAVGPTDFNNICWAYANEGFALQWALDACNRAVAIKPDESRYHSNRALAELRLGQFDRALDDYNQSIAADPREARAYYGRSLILFRQGKADAARDDRLHALELDPWIEETFERYGLSDLDKAAKNKP